MSEPCTSSVNLTWHLAVREAVAAKMREIEPEHFLATLTKLSGIDVKQQPPDRMKSKLPVY